MMQGEFATVETMSRQQCLCYHIDDADTSTRVGA